MLGDRQPATFKKVGNSYSYCEFTCSSSVYSHCYFINCTAHSVCHLVNANLYVPTFCCENQHNVRSSVWKHPLSQLHTHQNHYCIITTMPSWECSRWSAIVVEAYQRQASPASFYIIIMENILSLSVRYLSNSCSKKEVNSRTFRPRRSSSATKQFCWSVLLLTSLLLHELLRYLRESLLL